MPYYYQYDAETGFIKAEVFASEPPNCSPQLEFMTKQDIEGKKVNTSNQQFIPAPEELWTGD